ncbi:MAG: hypothetical protein ABIO70_22285 [Pseudomonadota bacterium]
MPDTPPIPDGVYANPSGQETLTFGEGQMTVHIVLIGQYAGQQFDRSYAYRQLEGGWIQPHPVRTADAVFGVGNFGWRWDGTSITQTEYGTGRVLQEFRRGPEGS